MKILGIKRIALAYFILGLLVLAILGLPLLLRPPAEGLGEQFSVALDEVLMWSKFMLIYPSLIILTSLTGWVISRDQKTATIFKYIFLFSLLAFAAIVAYGNLVGF